MKLLPVVFSAGTMTMMLAITLMLPLSMAKPLPLHHVPTIATPPAKATIRPSDGQTGLKTRITP